MMRNLVAGNWKSNKSFNESKDWLNEIKQHLQSLPENVKVMVAAPAPYLAALAEVKPEGLLLASQTVSATGSGAYTGEFTAEMLKGCGVDFALIGHSERRSMYGESDEIVVDKIQQCLDSNVGVVLCCGESLEIRDAGTHTEFISAQLDSACSNLESIDTRSFVIAYEPIWAIGTGRTASAQQAAEMHDFIRNWATQKFGKDTALKLSILYGGSCKPSNAEELFANENVDGGLIGGASLKVNDFIQIVAAAK